MPADLPAPTARVYFSQRLRLHYVDWGNAGAPTIVLLHGGGDHCRAWDRLARDLHPAYHVLAPDQRGHGESQWTTGGGSALLDYVYDLAVLIEQQQLSPVILIGHSRGGATGLHYAGLYPEHVRRVVAIEGVGRFEQRWGASPPERMAAWLEWVRERVRHRPRPYASIDAAAARLRERNPRFSPEQARHLALYGTYQNEDGSHVWKFDPLTMRSLPDLMEPPAAQALWRRISAPTLLIRGAESGAPDPAQDGTLSDFRNARSVTIDRAGHWVHYDQPQRFLQVVRAFLAE